MVRVNKKYTQNIMMLGKAMFNRNLQSFVEPLWKLFFLK